MHIIETLKEKFTHVKKPDLDVGTLEEKIGFDRAAHHNKNKIAEKPPHHGNGEFKNPWPSGEAGLKLPDGFPASREQEIRPSVKRIQVQDAKFNPPAGRDLHATWLGHAGVLVQMPPLAKGKRPLTLLIDPIFDERASPVEVAGPERRHRNPCKVEDLPQIDLLFISHNHYDHLSSDTLSVLFERKCLTTRFVVPLGLKAWFVESGVPEQQIMELDWWDEETLRPIQFALGDTEEDDRLGRITVACVPAQHTSARKGTDKQETLWAGFVVQQTTDTQASGPNKTTVYFAGDTGYRASSNGPTCPAFKRIGEKYGPMDFSAIPIWRGGTLSFIAQWGIRLNPAALTLATHATPYDAVCIHKDVQSRASLAIHFGTFAGSEDEATYPVALLEEACSQLSVPTEIEEENGFGVLDIGQTIACKAAAV